MAYELTGTIKKIFERQDFPSGFYKQEFVVTTDERFPQDIKLDCLKEKVDMLGNFQEGSPVKVSFDVRGREWNDRFFVDLSAWKIEPAEAGEAGEGQPARAAAPAKRKSDRAIPAEDPGTYEVQEEEEDLPF